MTVGWFFILITAFTGLSAWIASRSGGPGPVDSLDAGSKDGCK